MRSNAYSLFPGDSDIVVAVMGRIRSGGDGVEAVVEGEVIDLAAMCDPTSCDATDNVTSPPT